MTNWQAKKLGDIAKIYDGTHQTPKYIESGVPFYSVEQVTANNFESTKFVAEDVFEKESRRVVIENGDVLMTRIGDIGTARYVDWNPKASFYVSLALIKPFDIDGRFLSYVINSHYFQKELWKRSLTVAFPYKINLGDIGESELLVPKKLEQERILEVLEVWDEYIGKLERKITLKEQLKTALMQQYFSVSSTVETVELQDYVKSFSTGLNPRTNFNLGKGSNRYITIKNISNGNIKLKNAEFVDDAALSMIAKRSKLAKDDVIMSSIGNIGEAYLLKDEPTGWNINESVFSLKPNQAKVLPEYLYYLVTSEFAKRFFDNHMTGSSFKSIKMKDLKTMPVREVSLHDQGEIVKVLSNIDAQLDGLSEQREATKNQKKYLLKNLITGEIRTPENLKPKGAN